MNKLLKDKSDEMIRRFTIILRDAKRLREEVEAELSDVLKLFSVAQCLRKMFVNIFHGVIKRRLTINRTIDEVFIPNELMYRKKKILLHKLMK